jgi:tetratricopeptide (TPR) repeat protein
MQRLSLAALLALGLLLAPLSALADAADDAQESAKAAAAAGDYETAAKQATRAFSLARKNRGKSDASVGPLALQAGDYLLKNRQIDRAIAAYSMSVKNAVSNHGANSIKTVKPLRALAAAKFRNGDRSEALEMYERCATIVERGTGEDSPRTAAALVDVGRVGVQLARYGVARTQLRQAVRGFKKAGDDYARQLAEAQLLLGRGYLLDKGDPMNNYPEGGEWVRKAMAGYETNYPVGSQEVKDVYTQLLTDIAGTPMQKRMGPRLEEQLARHKAAK